MLMWNYEILKNLKIYPKSQAQKKNILESAGGLVWDLANACRQVCAIFQACCTSFCMWKRIIIYCFLHFALGQDLFNLERKEASVLSLESWFFPENKFSTQTKARYRSHPLFEVITSAHRTAISLMKSAPQKWQQVGQAHGTGHFLNRLWIWIGRSTSTW